MQRSTFVLWSLVASGLLSTSGAWAQAYPNRAIKLQVPFAPGGTTDIIARVIAEAADEVTARELIARVEALKA